MIEETPVATCIPTGNPKKTRAGLGMPASLYLHQFGELLFHAFGDYAYHVGSSLTGATWRDVDIRIMLEAEQYKAMGFGDPQRPHENKRWCAYTMAFSELGRRMTGLPIDFQIQETETASTQYDLDEGHSRSALILWALRTAHSEVAADEAKP
jgi:hypothetical protein